MRLTEFHDDELEFEDDGNLTAEAFSLGARAARLLAAVQLVVIRHESERPLGAPLCRCQLCRLYKADWWD